MEWRTEHCGSQARIEMAVGVCDGGWRPSPACARSRSPPVAVCHRPVRPGNRSSAASDAKSVDACVHGQSVATAHGFADCRPKLASWPEVRSIGRSRRAANGSATGPWQGVLLSPEGAAPVLVLPMTVNARGRPVQPRGVGLESLDFSGSEELHAIGRRVAERFEQPAADEDRQVVFAKTQHPRHLFESEPRGQSAQTQ